MDIGIRACRLYGLMLLVPFGLAMADEAAPVRVPQTEPIEFIDTVRPPQNDPANRRAALPMPTGWGFATFSQDNKFVATVSVPDGAESKGEVIVWDVPDCKPVVTFEQEGRITVAAISPDNKWLAIGPNGPQAGVQLVDMKTGKVGLTLPGPAARTNVIAWSPDGSTLVLGSTIDKTVRTWSLPEKTFLKAYEINTSKLLSIGFEKSGRLIAAAVPENDRDGFALFDVVEGTVTKSLKGHKQLVEAASFTTDASRLASAGWDATIRVWDVENGEESAVMKGHKNGVRALAMSADGKRIASSTDRGEFKLWDGEKHELLADLGSDGVATKFIAISPDGLWMASIARDGTARLWDVEQKSEKGRLDRNSQGATNPTDATDTAATRPNPSGPGDAPEPEAVQSLAYSRDGKWIALAREDGLISIRHAADGKIARELEAFGDVAACVAFSEDSQHIAAGSFDKTIKVWRVTTGEVLAELSGHTNWVFSVAFSPDGATLASGGYDKTVRLWNLADKKELATLSGHTAGVRSVAYTPDGQLLISGSADRTAMVWNLVDQKSIATLKGHAAAVRAVAVSPDGATIATASEDATVKLWKRADWTERASMSGTEGVMFWCLAFSPAGRSLAAGAFDGTVKLYDPADGKERQMLRGPTEAITAVAFAPDAHEIVAGSVDKSLRRWKAKVEAPVATAVATVTRPAEAEKAPDEKSTDALTVTNTATLNIEQPVSSLAYSKDGKRLLVGGGAYRVAGSLQLWDLVKHERIWKTDDFKFGIPAVAFSDDESRIAMGNFGDNFLRMFDSTTGKQLKEIRGHKGKIHGIAWSPKGPLIATASLDRDLKIWDASTNKEVKTLAGHSDYAFSVQFSPDGTRLLSGSADKTARLWNVETGKELTQMKGHQHAIQQAVFSKDGRLIGCASADYTARVYDGLTGDFLLTLRGHRNKVESIAFAADGQIIVTGSSDKTIRVWDSASGLELMKLTQEGIVRVIQFAPDGKSFATGCDDKTVRLWEVSGLTSREPVAKVQ